MENTKEKCCQTAAERALYILPPQIRDAAVRALMNAGKPVESLTDIRIRRSGRSYVTADRRHFPLEINIDGRTFDDMIYAFTGGSLYAHAETIREGYISVGGIRCGVCGRAVTGGGAIREVTDITSVTVRVARDIPGCSERVYGLIKRGGALSGALIYSPPGGGKTTLLRDLIKKLSEADRQLAVIDSRRELGSACSGGSADVLTDYPKDEGILCAVRSLCPELIICDELSGKNDADAALFAYSCGVPIVATAHAGSVTELRARGEMRALLDAGVFESLVGIGAGFRLITTA